MISPEELAEIRDALESKKMGGLIWAKLYAFPLLDTVKELQEELDGLKEAFAPLTEKEHEGLLTIGNELLARKARIAEQAAEITELQNQINRLQETHPDYKGFRPADET